MRSLLLAAGILVLSMSGNATASQVVDAPDLEMRVQNLLHSFQQHNGFPGATVAYALPGGVFGCAAVGHADLEARLNMTPGTRMLAASIGKTMIGALVLSLESEGLINLSDRISRYLGDLSWFNRLPNADEITVGHLLTHSAGLMDHVHMNGAALELASIAREGNFEPERGIQFVLDTVPLFKAGSGWSYSDTGYFLLGMAIESATGRDVFELAEERFLKPLTLKHTGPSNAPKLRHMAVGHTSPENLLNLPIRTMDKHGNLLWNPVIEWTAGGFVSTSHDLAKWGHAIFLGSAMETPYMDRLLDAVPISSSNPQVFYGSGVAIYAETELGPVYGHDGWLPGYVSSLRHYADFDITIAFQINSDIGFEDKNSYFIPALEHALAETVIEFAEND